MTDKERIVKLKKDITALLQEFDEETKGYYEIGSIEVIKSECEREVDYKNDLIIDGVELNIQV